MIDIEFGRNGTNGKLSITYAGQVVTKDIAVDTSVSKQHCRLTVSDDGAMTLHNLNPENDTFLNGARIKVKKFVLDENTGIKMGSNGFELPLKEIFKELGVRQTYSIAHIKDVILNYKNDKMRMQISLGRQNAMRGLMPVFMALAAVLGFTGVLPAGARIVPSLLSLVFACYFGYKGFVSASNNPKKQMELDNRYHKECVCPNPYCRHFLPGEYDDLLAAGSCPWCHTKFKE